MNNKAIIVLGFAWYDMNHTVSESTDCQLFSRDQLHKVIRNQQRLVLTYRVEKAECQMLAATDPRSFVRQSTEAGWLLLIRDFRFNTQKMYLS